MCTQILCNPNRTNDVAFMFSCLIMARLYIFISFSFLYHYLVVSGVLYADKYIYILFICATHLVGSGVFMCLLPTHQQLQLPFYFSRSSSSLRLHTGEGFSKHVAPAPFPPPATPNRRRMLRKKRRTRSRHGVDPIRQPLLVQHGRR